MPIKSATRRALAATSAIVSFTSVAFPAAASETQDAYYRHSRLCVGLFFSDHVAHAAQCLPNNSSHPPADNGTGGPALVPVVAPPPPPVAPVGSPCGCGPCNPT
jgi:hypothetical protein